jgi:hypothetical protein
MSEPDTTLTPADEAAGSPDAPPPLYVMTWDDTSYRLTGPFSTRDEAEAWGLRWEEEHGSDLRWEMIRLADPTASPTVSAP